MTDTTPTEPQIPLPDHEPPTLRAISIPAQLRAKFRDHPRCLSCWNRDAKGICHRGDLYKRDDSYCNRHTDLDEIYNNE